MAPDYGTAQDWLIWIGGLLLLVPFLTPVITSGVAVWLLRLNASALAWGVAFGVVTVPMSWVFLRFANGWYGWSVALVTSAALTAAFLWWRSRARHSA